MDFIFGWVFIIGIILIPVLIGIGFLLLSVKLTVWIETPIIVKAGVTGNKEYIRGINMLTNAVFNSVLVIMGFLAENYILIAWYVFAELLLIPVYEAYAYKKISPLSFSQVLKTSYIANILSCFVGLLISLVIVWLRDWLP